MALRHLLNYVFSQLTLTLHPTAVTLQPTAVTLNLKSGNFCYLILHCELHLTWYEFSYRQHSTKKDVHRRGRDKGSNKQTKAEQMLVEAKLLQKVTSNGYYLETYKVSIYWPFTTGAGSAVSWGVSGFRLKVCTTTDESFHSNDDRILQAGRTDSCQINVKISVW